MTFWTRVHASAFVGLVAFAAPLVSQGLAARVELAIIVQVVAPIRPVRGADDQTHLVYELLLVNPSALAVTVDSVAVLDGENGTLLKELSGEALGAAMRLSLFGADGTTLLPSQSALVFVDAALATGAPASVRHRISTTQAVAVAEGAADLGGLAVEPPRDVPPAVTFVTAPVPVDGSPTVVLAAPVRGAGWLIFRGCCDLATSHRGQTTAYDGTLYIAERFAIDFAQVAADGRLIAGPGNELASYIHYGQPVYAVADGTVISARDGEPDQVPGALPEGLTAETAGGNAVVLDIGDGRFAFYAHLKPGSVRVRAGDRVRSGDRIGLIGNSGKTFGPHLHFHVMDAASPGAADGLPYVFSTFTGQGALAGNGLMLALQGQLAPIDRSILAGPHRDQHPLNNQVVDFGN